MVDPEPNPPIWPNTEDSQVLVVTPEYCENPSNLAYLQQQVSDPYRWTYAQTSATNQDEEESLWTFTSEHQFGRRRRAVLLLPGRYRINLQVGYYSQILGLGAAVSDVVLEDHPTDGPRNGVFVSALDRHRSPPWGSCLNTFWRSVENLVANATGRSQQYDADLLQQQHPNEQLPGLQWCVSQAAPLRRVWLQRGLTLGDGAAYSSGGFIANARIDPLHQTTTSNTTTTPTSNCLDWVAQQQFLHRNVALYGNVTHGAWSFVLAGCTQHESSSSAVGNTTTTSNPQQQQQHDDAILMSRPYGGPGIPAVTVTATPRVRLEKPYLTVDPQYYNNNNNDNQQPRLQLRVPRVKWNPADTVGPDWMNNKNNHHKNNNDDDVRDLERVRVVRSDESHVTQRIQEALDDGKDVILAAGIFHLQATIEIRQSDRVILGIGMATLLAPSNGTPCIHVHGATTGVKVAGVMLEATPHDGNGGRQRTGISTLLEWGEPQTTTTNLNAHCANPGGLFDLFARVGGDTAAADRTKLHLHTMVRIHSPCVIGDNVWLWRADHARLQAEDPINGNHPSISTDYWQTMETEFRVKRGLEVSADNVTVYGLAVEHTNEHQTVWKGNHGEVVFYQSELPYGVSQSSFGGDAGFRGYLIKDGVRRHALYAPGIYSNFRNGPVAVATAIETPPHVPVIIHRVPSPHENVIAVVNPFTVLLDHHAGIQSIVNGKGGPALQQGQPMFLANALPETSPVPRSGQQHVPLLVVLAAVTLFVLVLCKCWCLRKRSHRQVIYGYIPEEDKRAEMVELT